MIKKQKGRTLLAFFLLVFSFLLLSEYICAGAERERHNMPQIPVLSAPEESRQQDLPPLIQTTTLEEDYKARVRLGLSFTRQVQEENPEQAFGNILCSCVRLQANEHYGSGSIYLLKEDQLIIVSNRHLLQYWDEDSFVTFVSGAAESGEVIGLSEEADVGFLSVPIDRFSWQELLELRNVRPLRKDMKSDENRVMSGEWEAESLSPGKKLLLIDMASDAYHPVMKKGEMISDAFYLEDFGMEMLYGTGEALPGMSGSGVFDGYGNYLGMLTGATDRGEIAAVPADVIHEAYEMLP